MIASGMASGCAILPIPMGRHVPKDLETRGPIPTATSDSLRVGQCTRADVMLALGEPDFAWEGGRRFLYRWATAGGYVLWGIAAGYQGAGGSQPYGTKGHDLYFEFDSTGSLKRSGSLATLPALAAGEAERFRAALPIEMAVGHAHAAGPAPARLALGADGILFGDEMKSNHDLRLALSQLVGLELRGFSRTTGAEEQMSCALVYQVGEGKKTLQMWMAPGDVLTLSDYLRLQRPDVRIGRD
jgi:hypothetical protein